MPEAAEIQPRVETVLQLAGRVSITIVLMTWQQFRTTQERSMSKKVLTT